MKVTNGCLSWRMSATFWFFHAFSNLSIIGRIRFVPVFMVIIWLPNCLRCLQFLRAGESRPRPMIFETHSVSVTFPEPRSDRDRENRHCKHRGGSMTFRGRLWAYQLFGCPSIRSSVLSGNAHSAQRTWNKTWAFDVGWHRYSLFRLKLFIYWLLVKHTKMAKE